MAINDARTKDTIIVVVVSLIKFFLEGQWIVAISLFNLANMLISPFLNECCVVYTWSLRFQFAYCFQYNTDNN